MSSWPSPSGERSPRSFEDAETAIGVDRGDAACLGIVALEQGHRQHPAVEQVHEAQPVEQLADQVRDPPFGIEPPEAEDPFAVHRRVEQGGKPQRARQVRMGGHQRGDRRVRDGRQRRRGQRRDAVVEPLHRITVQVHEIARDVDPDQLPFAAPVVEMAQHRAFDDIVTAIQPVAARDDPRARRHLDRAGNRLVQRPLLGIVEVVPQAAFQEQVGQQEQSPFASRGVPPSPPPVKAGGGAHEPGGR